MEFRSHPDKLLRDHLKEVSEKAEKYVIEAYRKDLSPYAKVAGGLHDVGKYTYMFQKYLSEGKRVDCSDHSLISSLIAFNEIYKKTSNDTYSFLTMASVYSHHGHLKGLTEIHNKLLELTDKIEFKNECIVRQYEDLKQKWDTIIKKELFWLELSDLPALEDLIETPLQKICNLKKNKKGFTWKEYLDGLLLFSSLIDADKHSASVLEELSSSLPDPEKVISYVTGLPKYNSEIDKMREELFQWAKREVPAENDILILSAPTGSGKTLSGVLIGLKSKKRRLIYSLPFISIIEQTGSVLSSVFSKDQILTYHHLSFDWNESENVDLESRMMLAESWTHPIIITTFEAFISSFLSNKNSYLKRLHNIANSFVILDEVQSLPVEKIALIIEAINELTKNLNAGVLIMSATVPFAFKNVEKPVSVTPNRYRIYFQGLDSFVSPSDLSQRIDISGKSVMIEMNTISSAEEIYQSLGDKEAQYLSTRVIPKERLERILKIKEKLERGEKVHLVTTQVVEAGVDLDFEAAYRDLGPLDSVVQTAGRVNRNYKKVGELFVHRIKRKEKNRTDFELVYGKITENVTLQTLKKFSGTQNLELDEKDIGKVLEIYYNTVKEYLRPDVSPFVSQCLKNVKSLEYNKIDVKLIDQELKYSVFIEYDDQAKKIWNELKNQLNIKTKNYVFERRANIKALIGAAQQYIVNLWERPDVDYDERLGWFYIPQEKVAQYYDKTLGFRAKNEEKNADLIW